MRVPATLVALPLIFAVSFGACSSDSKDKTEAQSEEGLEAAAIEAFEALIDSRFDDLYARLAQECRDKQSESDFIKEIAAGSVLLQAFLGSDLDELRVDDVQVRNVEDGRGEVRVRIEAPDDSDVSLDDDDFSFDPWVYEDGKWRSLECGSGDSFFDDAESVPGATPETAWTKKVPTLLGSQSGAVVLNVTEIRVGTPEGAYPDGDIPPDWDGVDSVVRFAVTIRNDGDRKVGIFAYSAKAVIEGKQVDVDTFASDLQSEILPHAAADMVFVVAVRGVAPEDVHDVRLAVDAPTDDETFEPLGPDLLIETRID